MPTSLDQPPFEPTVESLRRYQCPEWFRDAKFGIYVHWGVYSVSERGEWYGRRMYIEGDPVYEHHRATYGHPSTFGYKDFVPLWHAERFDPERLVDIFRRAGAKYLTPCAVHHDNFDLWDSHYHRWNSVLMGPHKDITGLWHKAAVQAGLRFGATTHLERSYSWFNVNKLADKSGPYQGVPYDGNDPAYAAFYFERHSDTDRRHPLNPPEHWRRTWALRIKDLIDHYQPDLLYFDGAVPFQGEDQGRTGLEVIAHLYNQNWRWHGGSQQAVMCLKNIPDHGFYWDGIATLDIERKRADELLAQPWQTDTSIGPWGYDLRRPYRPVAELVTELVDIVSKNGNVLLNVPPKADGTLDEQTGDILAQIGCWMTINGEGLYGTRPWVKHGEGDLRFTIKGDSMYVFILRWPGEGQQLLVPSLSTVWGTVKGVTLLGYPGTLAWRQEPEGLKVVLPGPPCEHAWALKVTR